MRFICLLLSLCLLLGFSALVQANADGAEIRRAV